jgi:phage terminase large subunit
LGYNRQYVREQPDTFTGAIKKSYGFRTTSATRPVIIANLVQIARDEIQLINDVDTLREMLSFVRIKGKPQAEEGEHDDLVMGLAITYGIREQQSMTETRKTQKKTRWEADQYDDYYAATPEQKKELIKRWGNPF